MKILTISSTEITDIGGVNFSIRRVAEELVKRGHECQVLSINPGNLPSEESISGVNIIRVKSLMSKYLYDFSLSMAQLLRRNLGKSLQPDIIHLHEYRRLLTPEVAYFVRSRHLPFVFSPYYAREEYNTLAGKYLLGYYKPVGKRMFDWSEAIIVHCEYSKNVIMEDFNIRPEKIKIIPLGVANLEQRKSKSKKEIQTPFSLLSAGVLIEKKGVQFIIQALRELKKRDRLAYLTIVGDGSYEPQLRMLASKLGVESNIFWYKPLSRDSLHQKFMEAEIFLLLSRAESYGIVVTEALAAGTPCIVTKTTSLTEFLTEPGCFGVDYPPDPNEVADLIIKIRETDIKVGPLSDKIRGWDKVAADLERLYKQVLETVDR
jgi:glycosyltransferase involved in cell wall biosynthesis